VFSYGGKFYNSLSARRVKPLATPIRLTLRIGKWEVIDMYEWTFSSTAEWVIGALLVAAIVAVMFV
jgi:hypothetical protein